MFKDLFIDLITTLTGADFASVPVQCLSMALSLIFVTIIVFALMRLVMPNSKKFITIIVIIIVMMICVVSLASYDIAIINITQYPSIGGVA